MNFANLQSSLLVHLRRRLHNGEWSERGLARFVGISQPHMHNVLRGVRPLTPEVADGILSRLGLDLLALAGRAELELALAEAEMDDGTWQAVPLVSGVLGPLAPWPNLDSRTEMVRLEARCLGASARPVLVRLGADPGMELNRDGGWLALLDRSGPVSPPVRDGDWCALRLNGSGCVRQVRVTTGGLRVSGQMSLLRENEVCPEFATVPNHSAQARVLWTGPDPRLARPLDQAGFLARPTISR